jgi:hypothetical protein
MLDPDLLIRTVERLDHQLKDSNESHRLDRNLYIEEKRDLLDKLKAADQRFAALQEITIERLQSLRLRNKQLEAFYDYFTALSDEGLEIMHWHANGTPESLTTFYDDAVELMTGISEEDTLASASSVTELKEEIK